MALILINGGIDPTTSRQPLQENADDNCSNQRVFWQETSFS